ncbi:MAG: hypothetical protein IGR92_06740 [Leptolyngbyaceae cyanobacterium T60_A2020_046]|nr:hypothetical protein [Leptolyngbyaceae cyanobacterium T60_A2020_046]
MRRLTALGLVSCLGLSVTSCGFINGLLNRGEDSGEVATEEVPLEGEVTEGEGEIVEGDGAEAETAFEEPFLPGLPTAAAIASAELIQSTDPAERLREIQAARPDPYALVPVPPAPRPVAPPAPEDTPGQAAGDGGGGTTTPRPSDDDFPAFDPLPLLPEATVAATVAVSGVVQVSGETYAIINAPGEPTSRYVRVGDRLSNGTILVKRIEMRPGSNPVVVFEENGVEVALPVGAGTGPEEATAEAPGVSAVVASSAIAPLPVLR